MTHPDPSDWERLHEYVARTIAKREAAPWPWTQLTDQSQNTYRERAKQGLDILGLGAGNPASPERLKVVLGWLDEDNNGRKST